jgi:hypothetical protein
VANDKIIEGREEEWPCSPALEARIKQLVDTKSRQIEANVTSVALELHKEIREEQRSIRREVRRDHNENRVRMQATHEVAAKGVAQNEMIMAEQQGTKSLMLELLGKVNTLAGRMIGERTAEDRINAQESREAESIDRKKAWWFNILRWVLGLGGGSTLLNWIHHHWDKP